MPLGLSGTGSAYSPLPPSCCLIPAAFSNPRASRVFRWLRDETARLRPATIRAIQVNHWGARIRYDVHRSYSGYLIEAGRYRVLFAGDTAYTDSFRSVRSSNSVDLAIMPIGAYDPWIRGHCNPEQALAMANDAGAEFILPVHHRTFERRSRWRMMRARSSSFRSITERSS
jgi:L-ascorbate metabolism protein UlaG (beta-lactamase superfamily)